MNRFTLVLPRTPEEMREALAKGGVAKAAGIDLVDRMKEGVVRPDRVVSLAAMRGDHPPVEVGPDGARIAAFATLAEVADHPAIRDRYPALAHAAGEAATPQIRNRATVGGNLLQEPRCWYYRLADFTCMRKGGEGCPAIAGENRHHAILGHGACPVVHASNLAPALVALGATATISGREEPAPVESLWPTEPDPAPFHSLAPTEILESVALPAVGANAYVEIRHKQSFDWPLASAAVARHGETWRVVLGCVAPVPWRSMEAEQVLGAATPDAGHAARAADAAVAGARPLSGNAYKVKIARAAVARALAAATGGAK